jgi:hypothetical protein
MARHVYVYFSTTCCHRTSLIVHCSNAFNAGLRRALCWTSSTQPCSHVVQFGESGLLIPIPAMLLVPPTLQA